MTFKRPECKGEIEFTRRSQRGNCSMLHSDIGDTPGLSQEAEAKMRREPGSLSLLGFPRERQERAA